MTIEETFGPGGYLRMATAHLERNPTVNLTPTELAAALKAFDEDSRLDWTVSAIAAAVSAARAANLSEWVARIDGSRP